MVQTCKRVGTAEVLPNPNPNPNLNPNPNPNPNPNLLGKRVGTVERSRRPP